MIGTLFEICCGVWAIGIPVAYAILVLVIRDKNDTMDGWIPVAVLWPLFSGVVALIMIDARIKGEIR